MSDLTGLIANAFLLVMSAFLVQYIANSGAAHGGQVLTGVIEGTPISVGGRRGLLFQMWLPNQFMGFAMMVFIALTEVRIADNVGDADIKLLAHLAAFLAACVALMFSVNAVLGTRNYGRFLRRIERK